MKTSFYPLYIRPLVSIEKGSAIRFRLPDQSYYDIYEDVALIWAILEACNGKRTAENVVTYVQTQNSSMTSTDVKELLQDLIKLGIVVDSRRVFSSYHEFTNNPSHYPKDLTIADVRKLRASKRMAVKQGTQFPVRQIVGELSKLQSKRRSCRSFDSRPVPKDSLGHILVSGYSLPLHTSPSGGGLYPIKLYVVITGAKSELSRGYYEYDPEQHTLVLFNEQVDDEQLKYIFGSDGPIYGANTYIVIAADFERSAIKYGDRGYRLVQLEAGHIAQNKHLASVESGIASLEYGGFLEGAMAMELGLDESKVAPLILLAVGYPSEASSPTLTPLLESLEKNLIGPNGIIKSLNTITRSEQDEVSYPAITVQAYAKVHGHKDKTIIGSGIDTSLAQAKVKAVAEAYERYVSGVIRVDRIATAQKLEKEGLRWIDPRRTHPLTKVQYKHLPQLLPFLPASKWQWVEGKVVSTGAMIMVPVDLVFYPLDTKELSRKSCIIANSSGVAAYVDEEGAQKRGLLELIERHSLMSHWMQRKAPARIPMHSLPYHWQRRVAYWESRGRNVYVLDISLFGVAIVQVLIVSDNYPAFVSGAAASNDTFEQALSKAFQEAEALVVSQLDNPVPELKNSKEVTSVMDHQVFYSSPENLQFIRWLWSGEVSHKPQEPRVDFSELIAKLGVVSVRLTASDLDSPFVVVRILSDQLVPIGFGYWNTYYTHPILPNIEQPEYPHYVA